MSNSMPDAPKTAKHVEFNARCIKHAKKTKNIKKQTNKSSTHDAPKRVKHVEFNARCAQSAKYVEFEADADKTCDNNNT
jgi:hypothetical protein